MKILFYLLLTSLAIYSYTKRPELFNIIKYLIIFYTILEFLTRIVSPKTKNTLKSKIFYSNWNSTGDTRAYFNVTVKTKKVEDFILEYNKKNPEKKLTVKHFGMKCLAMAIYKNRSFGQYSFGNFTNLDNVDLTVYKSYKQKEVFHIIRNCSGKSIEEIRDDLKNTKKKILEKFDKREKLISKYIPTFLIKAFVDFLILISYSLKIDIPFFDYKKMNFGKAYFIAYEKDFSLNQLYMPFSHHVQAQVVVVMKKIKDEPVFLEDGTIGVERRLDFCATSDHRNGDGSDLMSLIPNFKQVFQNPEKFV